MSFTANEDIQNIEKADTGLTLQNNSSIYEKTFTHSQSSLIGKAVRIKGDITAHEDILIDGHISGSIGLKHNRLEVGVTGCIEANSFAKVIVISGEVHGDSFAKERIIVTKSGRVNGNIYAPDVHVENGALLKGSINMDMQDVIKDYFDEEEEESNQESSSSFGFLFRKSKALPHAEAAREESYPENCPVSSQQDGDAICALPERSIIGKTVTIKGNVEADEDVLIQGEVNGIIHFKNNNLELGHQAKIEANIFVKSLVTAGDIKGDIYASEHVALKKPAHVFGTIRAPRVSIESGAVLMGNIEMEQQDIEKMFTSYDTQQANQMDQATKTKKQQTGSSRRLMEAVDNEKVTTVSSDQFTVSRNQPKRMPWPE